MSPRCSGIDRRVGVCVWQVATASYGPYFWTRLMLTRRRSCEPSYGLCGAR